MIKGESGLAWVWEKATKVLISIILWEREEAEGEKER